MDMNERILAGRYRLQEAVGGRSDLWRAHDEALGRQVAVKRLAAGVTEGRRRQLEPEIAKAAGLHDPHLLAVYDAVWEEDVFYLVTEDLEGDSLARYVRDQSKVEPERAVDLICQLAGAVVQAEKNGVFELSIDPKTVLIDEGYLKVIEYGPLATASRAQSTREQIHTVGVLLYELLTGNGWSDLAPTRQVVQDVHQALAAAQVHHSWLPERMESIAHRALGLLAEGGYQSMQELHKDVKAVRHAIGQAADLLGERGQTGAKASAGSVSRVEQVRDTVLGAAQEGMAKVAQVRKMEFVKQMTEKSTPKKRSPLLYALAAVVLVIVTGGLWWTASGEEATTVAHGEFQGKEVKMPNLINKTEQQAVQILTENGFPQNRIQWVYKPTDERLTKGKIYQQSVDPNTQVVTGEQMIVLTVNGTMTDGQTAGESNGSNGGNNPNGQESVTAGVVPDLRGMSQPDAEQMLLKLGYRYSFEIKSGGDTPAGTVYQQQPAAGSKAEQGARVTFYVNQ